MPQYPDASREQVPAPVAGQPADEDLRQKRAARRRLLVGGAALVPTIVTLANTPAIATSQACSMSLQLSSRLSGPATLTSCGDSYSTWYTRANTTSLWNQLPTNVTQYAGTTIASVFLSSYTHLSVPTNQSFLSALAGNVALSAKYGSSNTFYQIDSGTFLAQAVAAVLNGALYGAAFGYTNAAMITAVKQYLSNMNSDAAAASSSTKTTPSNLQTEITKDTSALATLNSQG